MAEFTKDQPVFVVEHGSQHSGEEASCYPGHITRVGRTLVSIQWMVGDHPRETDFRMDDRTRNDGQHFGYGPPVFRTVPEHEAILARRRHRAVLQSAGLDITRAPGPEDWQLAQLALLITGWGAPQEETSPGQAEKDEAARQWIPDELAGAALIVAIRENWRPYMPQHPNGLTEEQALELNCRWIRRVLMAGFSWAGRFTVHAQVLSNEEAAKAATADVTAI